MDYSIFIILGVVVVMFLFMGRSNKKQERAQQEMRNNLSVGDEITTIGGIIGKVVSIKEETMVIETTRDHTRIRLLKSAVRSVDVPANVKFVAPEPVVEAPAEAPVEPVVKSKKGKKKEQAAAAEEIVLNAEPAANEAPATEEKKD